MQQGQPPIGPFFFEDETEEAVTITEERYINLALTPFWEAIRHLPGIQVEEQWFQQDGATPHTANATPMCIATTDLLPWETRQPEDGGAVGPTLAGPVTA